MDWQGAGFYAQTARRGGIAHEQHGPFFVVCHGPTLWSDLGSASGRRDPRDALTYFIERRSIELADAVISPSAYLLDWLRAHKVRLPKHHKVWPNMLAQTEASATLPVRRAPRVPTQLVFFGRLEYRKGLIQFCDAIDCMIAAENPPSAVTFLGKFGFVGGEHAALYIARRTRKWPFAVSIEARMGQPQAVAYLAERNCLAVVPSTVENSPYTVYECLAHGIPVIARRTGGIPELFDESSRASHLFDDNPRTLAARMTDALQGNLPAASLAFDPARNLQEWTELMPKLASKLDKARRKALSKNKTPDEVLVSLCLTHYQRPSLLKQALSGIGRQTHKAIEVILVDDGSADSKSQHFLDRLEPEFQRRGWKIIRASNGYPGRARNLAAAEASGKYLLFMDDDNVAMPTMVSAYVEAAERTGAPVVSSFSHVFSGTSAPTSSTPVVETYIPVGGAIGYSLYGNSLADANALISAEYFKSIGGYTEDYGLGHEDLELYLRIALRGDEILILPEPLFWYRRSQGTVNNATPASANRSRSLRPFLEQQQPEMLELLVVAHGRGDIPPLPDQAEPTDASAENEEFRQNLRDYDPDSWQAVDAAAFALAAEGQFGLAAAILGEIPSDMPRAGLRLGISGALERIACQRFQELPDVLAACKRSNRERIEALSLLAPLVLKLDAQQAMPLIIQWCQTQPDAIRPLILMTEALVARKDTHDALRAFGAALVIGDQQYRQRRPDIDLAVSRGDFPSGLAHYARHGVKEQAPWPETDSFRNLMASINRLLDGAQIHSGTAGNSLLAEAQIAFSCR